MCPLGRSSEFLKARLVPKPNEHRIEPEQRGSERVSNSCLNLWRYCASFINVVEAGKFPAAFGQFELEANWCVLAIARSFFKRTIDLTPPVGFFSWFGGGKTLRGIGLASKNFIITAQEVVLVFYGFDQIGHRQWEFRHLNERRFIACDDSGSKFLPECRKVGLRKSVWQEQQNQNSG